MNFAAVRVKLLSSCLKCLNSACCKKFDVEVSVKEYLNYDIVMQSSFIKKSENQNTIDQCEKMSEKRKKRFKAFIDRESEQRFAKLKKDEEGYCVFLNKKSMLCSIYEKRPDVCRNFKEERCGDIRVLKNAN